MLRRIFGPKRDEATGDYIRRSLMICVLTEYYWGDPIKRNKMVWRVACKGRGEVYTGFAGESCRKATA